MKELLIKGARAVVTCDGADRVLEDADVLTGGGKILAVGQGLERDGAEVIDASGKYVYPGLINTHHHFFQAFVRNILTIDRPNLTLVQWLDRIYRVFEMIDDEVIFYASCACMADLIKHGCTCAVDHQYCYTPLTGLRPVDRQMEAAELMGLRFTAARGTNTLPREKGSTVPDGMVETTETYIRDCERLIARYHDPSPESMRQIVLAPAQPLNSERETFVETVDLARDRGVFMHTHLNEGENAQMVARYGMRSLDWCEEIGFAGPDVWYAHCRENLPGEYARIAAAGSGISHCPAPTIYGGSEILDMPGLTAAGVPISIGCDGCSTNEGSNMLDSLRLAYLMQAFMSKERGGCPTPGEILKMGTVCGARMIGRPELGSIEEGKAADLFMIDAEKLEYAGALHDPASIIPKLGITGEVWMTMIAGKVVFRDGRLQGVDEERLLREGEAVCTKVLRDRCAAFEPYRGRK